MLLVKSLRSAPSQAFHRRLLGNLAYRTSIMSQEGGGDASQKSSGPAVPPHLIEELRAGRVIAFVGAGFSIPAGFCNWKQLLLSIAEAGSDPEHPHHIAEFGVLEESVKQAVSMLLGSDQPSAHQFGIAAQMLDDALHKGSSRDFQEEIVAYMRVFLAPRNVPLPKPMIERLQLLHSLPFKAIFTTNFNPLICGRTPFDRDVIYRQVLRGDVVSEGDYKIADGYGSSPTELTYKMANCPVIQLHGHLRCPRSIVLTGEGYRRLMYESPGYDVFLKSALASHTVLYMGFSFSDAYVNEWRSELQQMLGGQSFPDAPPTGYAIIPDKTEEECKFFRLHEGIEFLTWDTAKEGWDPFVDLLRACQHACSL